MHKIYKYTNTSNGKIYIGQTSKTLNERAGKNGKNYCESNRFYAAIKKYGWESFVSEIIADNLTQDEANAFEIYYIDLFDSTNPDYGYNIQLGGNHRNQTDEGKTEISRKARERYKDRTKNPMYGKRHSPEAIEKMRGKKVGELNPMYGTSWTLTQREKCGSKQWYYEQSQEYKDAWAERARNTHHEGPKKRVKCAEDDLCFDTVTSAAEYYGVSVSTLSGHLHGNCHTCAGKHFSFID